VRTRALGSSLKAALALKILSSCCVAMATLFAKSAAPPTPEEVARAEAIIAKADGKEKLKLLRSKTQCLLDWAKLNLSADQIVQIRTSEGDARLHMLAGYMAMMAKQKSVGKKKILEQKHNVVKTQKTEVHEWNSEVMDEKWGPCAHKLCARSHKACQVPLSG
jgi:hypothetical protein